jgi:HEAT repeat protein
MTARGWCRQVAGAIVVAALLEGNPARAAEQAAVAAPAAVHEAIAALGRLDYDTRLRAARTLRRTPPEVAVPALRDAVAHHADGYVRYRALVLLVGFRDAATRDLMRQALRDGNDRLRAVAYAYFEHEPDPLVVPQLVAALETERSEFVRPALTRAVAAAAAADETARAAILPLVERGEDVFRAAVIEALGDHRVAAAVPALEAIARREGPLQDDAVRALGLIGDARALRTLREVQAGAAREVQPGLAAAFCLLDAACERHEAYLRETLAFAVRTAGYQELLRATATALATLAVAGRASALEALVDHGVRAEDPARAPLALASGTVALRNPTLVLAVLEHRADLEAAVSLLRDAFDMLEEDFEEERFFAAVRRAYWAAPEGSARRRLCETLIARLEF